MSPAAATHSIPARGFANRGVATDRPPAAALYCELLGAWVEKGAYYVALTLGSGSVIFPCRREDLRSYSRFRKLVLRERGVAIYSTSQGSGSYGQRREAWLDDVRRAERRGAAA